MAAQNSNLSEEFMRHYEESAPGIFSRSLYSYYQMPMTDQIYIAQSNLIKQLAAKGRASSSAAARTSSSRTASKFTCTPTLKSASNANFPWIRAFPPRKWKNTSERRTKSAKNITEYYTDQKWGMAENHNLCMDSSVIGVDGCVETALVFLKQY